LAKRAVLLHDGLRLPLTLLRHAGFVHAQSLVLHMLLLRVPAARLHRTQQLGPATPTDSRDGANHRCAHK